MRIDSVSPTGIPVTPEAYAAPKTKGFSDLFMQAVGQANHQQGVVENLIERSAAGENLNPAVVASAVNKADLAFRTLIQMRNKLTEAFNELRQLQV